MKGQVESRDEGTDLMYGAGLEYRFKFGLAIRAEWERFTNVTDQDIDLASGGVSYTF